MSISIGIFFQPIFKAIATIFLGSLLHLFLDFFQNSWDSGNLIFYPISFKTFSLKLFTFGIDFKYIYVLFFLFIISIIFFQKKENLNIYFSLKKIIISFLSLVVLILIMIGFYKNTLYSDYGFLNLRFHPKEYDKKIIELNIIPLTQRIPPKVYFRHQSLLLLNFTPAPKFNNYDIQGIYDYSKKTINVLAYHGRNRVPKIIISTLGLLIFLLYMVFKIKYKIIKE